MRALKSIEQQIVAGGLYMPLGGDLGGGGSGRPPGGGGGSGDGGDGGDPLIDVENNNNHGFGALADATGLDAEFTDLGLQAIIGYAPNGAEWDGGNTIIVSFDESVNASASDLAGALAHEIGHYTSSLQGGGSIDAKVSDYRDLQQLFATNAMDSEGWAQISAIQQSQTDVFMGFPTDSETVPGDPSYVSMEEQTYWQGIENGTPMSEIASQIGWIMSTEVENYGTGQTYEQFYDSLWEDYWDPNPPFVTPTQPTGE